MAPLFWPTVYDVVVGDWQEWCAALTADGGDASVAQARRQMAEHSYPSLTVQVDDTISVVVVDVNSDPSF